jgi:tetratricopeptide (TPR) repeat protein
MKQIITHNRSVLYSFLSFLLCSANLFAQTPKYDFEQSIINQAYADSVPIKQLLPRADRTIKSKLPNCYVVEGDSIITGMKYTYTLNFVSVVWKKYCNGVIIKDKSKGFLPDSIYQIVWTKLEKHQKDNESDNASVAEGYFEEAKRQLKLNRNGAAIAGFMVAANVHSSVKEAAFINIGLCLYNLKRYEDASYYYQLAIKENPKSYEAYLNMGATAKYLKNDSGFSMESVYFKIAYNLKPHAHKAIYNYATTVMSQFDRNNNDLAIKLLTEATSLDPENPLYIWALGKAYYNISGLGNQKEAIQWYKKAIEYYDKAIALDPKFHEAYLSKARSLYALYEGSSASSDQKAYMDAMNACYAAFKASGGEDKTELFKRILKASPKENKI